MCPDLTLRSTFIAGFPGETEADFEHLLSWLKEAQLDRVGCFKYEAVEGARANQLPNAIPEELKQERWERLMEAQQAISAARLQSKIGKSINVIVDEVCLEPDEQGAVARSQGDAPEIDGNVFIDLSVGDASEPPGLARDLSCGDVVEVKIHDADEYDLYGHIE